MDGLMRIACHNGHLSVCQWLILNSALNDEEDHVKIISSFYNLVQTRNLKLHCKHGRKK